MDGCIITAGWLFGPFANWSLSRAPCGSFCLQWKWKIYRFTRFLFFKHGQKADWLFLPLPVEEFAFLLSHNNFLPNQRACDRSRLKPLSTAFDPEVKADRIHSLCRQNPDVFRCEWFFLVTVCFNEKDQVLNRYVLIENNIFHFTIWKSREENEEDQSGKFDPLRNFKKFTTLHLIWTLQHFHLQVLKCQTLSCEGLLSLEDHRQQPGTVSVLKWKHTQCFMVVKVVEWRHVFIMFYYTTIII